MWRKSSSRRFLGILLISYSYSASAASLQGLAGSLQEQLQAQGWQSTIASDGSLIFTPPASSATELMTGESAEEPRASYRLTDSLLDSLEQQGWQMKKDVAGNVIATPPASSTNKINSQAPVSPNTNVTGSLLRELNRQGWQIRRGEDGSYTATHPAVTVVPDIQAGTDEPRDGLTSESEQLRGYPKQPGSLATQLDAVLRQSPAARYWRSGVGPDGSVILQPVAQVADTMVEAAPAAACAGVAVPAAKGRLPLSDTGDAVFVATRWLAGTDLADQALVGRIRKVPRAFMISIVQREAPFGLLHQIAVRARDGHVLVID